MEIAARQGQVTNVRLFGCSLSIAILPTRLIPTSFALEEARNTIAAPSPSSYPRTRNHLLHCHICVELIPGSFLPLLLMTLVFRPNTSCGCCVLCGCVRLSITVANVFCSHASLSLLAPSAASVRALIAVSVRMLLPVVPRRRLSTQRLWTRPSQSPARRQVGLGPRIPVPFQEPPHRSATSRFMAPHTQEFLSPKDLKERGFF